MYKTMDLLKPDRVVFFLIWSIYCCKLLHIKTNFYTLLHLAIEMLYSYYPVSYTNSLSVNDYFFPNSTALIISFSIE